jgi:prolyl oligopeptidase
MGKSLNTSKAKQGNTMNLLIASIAAGAALSVSAYAFQPTTRPVYRQDNVVDDFHGTKVADPFRWLEEPDAPDTQKFIADNNAAFRAFVDGETRERIAARLTELIDYPRMGTPSILGGGRYYLYTRNNGLQNQSPLFIADSIPGTLDGSGKLLIDPNTLSDDGTVALSGLTWTRDASMFAYGLSVGGSDQRTVKIRDMATGEDLPGELTNMRFSGIAWLPDKSGFYYNQFPEPGSVPPEEMAKHSKLFLYKIGQPQADAQLVFAPEDPELSPYPFITEDEQFLVVYLSRGTSPKYRVHWKPLNDPGALRPLFTQEDANYSIVGNDGTTFYVQTDKDAPLGKLVAVDANNPAPENWRVLIPEANEPIDSVSLVADQFVVKYLRDAQDVLKIFKLDGTFDREIELPTVGSASLAGAQRRDRRVFISFTSFTYPSSSFLYDFDTHTLTPHFQPPVKFDPAAYESKQIFATSRDGTRIPVFVVHKKGLTLDGSNPTILNGYGGFNVSMGPYFSTFNVPWLEAGGVFALAVLRGGGEYGEQWHQAGMLGRKQNVFDDFIAASEKLIEDGYTRAPRLAIEGGSNGGLLTAAVVLQRPDLFGAVLSQVPVIDMLRYHRLSVGRFWVPEYGSADNSEQFEFLIKYSPLHNVKPNISYPPILITTAEGDDRVVPAHAYKWAATLHTISTSPHPVFLRTEVKAGHGAGKPISKAIDEQADIYAFLARVFEMTW